MTTTAEKIEILKAYDEGKTLIATNDVSYLESDINKKTHGDYKFNFYAESFRIKPQPKVIYVNEYECGDPLACWGERAIRAIAKNKATGSPLRAAIKYIELTPELEKLAKEGGLL